MLIQYSLVEMEVGQIKILTQGSPCIFFGHLVTLVDAHQQMKSAQLSWRTLCYYQITTEINSMINEQTPYTDEAYKTQLKDVGMI